jgi:hypothetical protein
MGCVSLTELEEIQFPPFGLGVERDKFFQADRDLTEYWDEARELGYISA